MFSSAVGRQNLSGFELLARCVSGNLGFGVSVAVSSLLFGANFANYGSSQGRRGEHGVKVCERISGLMSLDIPVSEPSLY